MHSAWMERKKGHEPEGRACNSRPPHSSYLPIISPAYPCHENLWHVPHLQMASLAGVILYESGKGLLTNSPPRWHFPSPCTSGTTTGWLCLPLDTRLSKQLLAARIGFKSEVDFLLMMFPPKDLKKINSCHLSPSPSCFYVRRQHIMQTTHKFIYIKSSKKMH